MRQWCSHTQHMLGLRVCGGNAKIRQQTSTNLYGAVIAAAPALLTLCLPYSHSARLVGVSCALPVVCSFQPLACMGDHSEMMARTMLALTLKVEGGMWLRATHRTA